MALDFRFDIPELLGPTFRGGDRILKGLQLCRNVSLSLDSLVISLYRDRGKFRLDTLTISLRLLKLGRQPCYGPLELGFFGDEPRLTSNRLAQRFPLGSRILKDHIS